MKYNNPVLVNGAKGKGKKGKGLPPVADPRQQLSQTEDILNSILPPREWTSEGQLWVQYVSSTPSTRLDVISLQVRGWLACGVACGVAWCVDVVLRVVFCCGRVWPRNNWTKSCSSGRPVKPAFAPFAKSCMRSALMSSSAKSRLTAPRCVSVSVCLLCSLCLLCSPCCSPPLPPPPPPSPAQRGVLLLNVRDEVRLTIAAYQTLYESSIAFGMRKALMAEQRKAELEAKIKHLQTERVELERQVATLKARCEEIETQQRERQRAEEEAHAEEVQKLQSINDHLKKSLEALLAPPKK